MKSESKRFFLIRTKLENLNFELKCFIRVDLKIFMKKKIQIAVAVV